MVEFSDLFDNEDDVFQKKAKVWLNNQTHTDQPSAPLRSPWLIQAHASPTLVLLAQSLRNYPGKWGQTECWKEQESKEVTELALEWEEAARVPSAITNYPGGLI